MFNHECVCVAQIDAKDSERERERERERILEEDRSTDVVVLAGASRLVYNA